MNEHTKTELEIMAKRQEAEREAFANLPPDQQAKILQRKAEKFLVADVELSDKVASWGRPISPETAMDQARGYFGLPPATTDIVTPTILQDI